MFKVVVRRRTRIATVALAIAANLALEIHASKSVTIAWDPNPETNITHYHVLYGTSSRTYSLRETVGAITSAAITNLQEGLTYYFAVTAENVHGLESDPSIELSYSVPVAPQNEPPLAGADSFASAEDAVLTITFNQLLANDRDPNPGDTISVVGGGPGSTAGGSAMLSGSSIVFAPRPDFSGNDTFPYVIRDNNGLTATGLVAVAITAVNDRPTISGIANRATNEDTAAGPVSFTVGDVDNSPTALTLSGVSSNPGLVPIQGISVGGSGTNRSVTITPAANQTGTATISLSASDGLLSATSSFQLTVNPVNDPPAMVLTRSNLAYSRGTGSLLLDPGAIVTDLDSADLDSGVLRLAIAANGNADDRLRVIHEGTSAGKVGVLGTNVSYGGVLVGNWSGGANGSSPLQISFNATATPVIAGAVLRRVGYENVSVTASPLARSIQATLSDGDGGQSGTVSLTVAIESLVVDPVIAWAPPAAITYGQPLGANQLNASANVPGVFVYQPPAGTVLNSGNAQSLSVTFTPYDLASYNPVSRNVSLDVQPASLTIRADDLTRAEGEANPPLTASYLGLANGDTAGSLDSPPVLTTTATQGSPPGTYPITASGGADPNYTITRIDGVLTITAGFAVRVNFQPANAGVPNGYLGDGGLVFGNRGNGHNFGWDRNTTSYMYDRNSKRSPDQRYDTFAWLDRSNGGRVWEIAVPNGLYEVFVVAGDPNRYDSVFRLEVEGVTAVNGNARRSTRWLSGQVTVNVGDGRLTLRGGSGAKNNKVCFIEITKIVTGQAAAVQLADAMPLSVHLATPILPGPKRVIVSGVPATRYLLQASPDLLEWSDMLFIELNRSGFEYLDPDSTEEAVRFYKVIEDSSSSGGQ